ncbi:MAG: hypothetical protein ACT4O2_09970 [Beijerinckiaceae bacterium]
MIARDQPALATAAKRRFQLEEPGRGCGGRSLLYPAAVTVWAEAIAALKPAISVGAA